ncbi:oligosaccharide repeat unit polymerase [Arthrobacter sp. UYCu511]|uniref:O-antigen polymerase n=1 Tax=Arthrobacter sp. UYCu511 TaxID=3156337 RepID=UPI0033911968
MSIVLFLSSILCLTGIWRSFKSGFRPAALVFYTFSFCWIVVASAIQINEGVAAWRDSTVLLDTHQVSRALELTLLAFMAFGCGEFFSSVKKKNLIRFSVAFEIRPWMLFVYGVCLVVLTPLVIRSSGGLGGLFSSRNELSSMRRSAGVSIDVLGGPAYAVIRILPGALAIAIILLLIVYSKSLPKRAKRQQTILILAVIAIGVTLVIYINPFTSTRYTLATFLGATLLIFFRVRSVRWGFISAVGMMFAVLVAYPFGNLFRYSETVSLRSGVDAYTGPDFDGFQQIINTLNYVQENGHTFGNQILSGMGFFIPRSVWETKSEPASYAVAESAGYSWTNLSLPLHAEFYMEFGYIGMIILMIFMGWLIFRLDEIWLYSATAPHAVISAYISFAMLGIMRGPIGAQIPTWGLVVALLYIAVRAAKTKNSIAISRTFDHE